MKQSFMIKVTVLDQIEIQKMLWLCVINMHKETVFILWWMWISKVSLICQSCKTVKADMDFRNTGQKSFMSHWKNAKSTIEDKGERFVPDKGTPQAECLVHYWLICS